MAKSLKSLKIIGIMIFVGAVIKLIFIASVAHPFDQSTPELAIVNHLESILVLPHQARPLSSYIRYYAQEVIQGKKHIVATFLYNGSPGRLELIEAKKRPVIEDGGCDVLELRYSLADNRIISFACNGLG